MLRGKEEYPRIKNNLDRSLRILESCVRDGGQDGDFALDLERTRPHEKKRRGGESEQ